jgi:hypothetical protein
MTDTDDTNDESAEPPIDAVIADSRLRQAAPPAIIASPAGNNAACRRAGTGQVSG